MTLGGLALAVGILVDDATVTIENIERHMGLGEKLEDAILKGAGEIALPAFVSTFCICIVFIPMFFLSGVAHYLFVPFAEAVVFAVIASYVLSRTLVPTLVMWFERHNHEVGREDGHVTFWVRPFVAFQHAFERGFDRFRSCYRGLLGTILNHRGVFAVAFSPSAPAPGFLCHFSARTSFRQWTRAHFDCMCAPLRERVLKKRPTLSTRWKPR